MNLSSKTSLVLGLCALACAPARAAYNPNMGAVVTAVQGDVMVSTSPKADWMPAEKGMRCAAASSIRTGADGSAEMMFEDGTALRIDANSSVGIKTAVRKNLVREFVLDLFSGRLLSNVVKVNKDGKVK